MTEPLLYDLRRMGYRQYSVAGGPPKDKDSVMFLFTWSATPEGDFYWRDVDEGRVPEHEWREKIWHMEQQARREGFAYCRQTE